MLAAVSRRFCWPDHDWVGYVLFYIGGNAVVVPEYSYPLWGDNEAQHKISHYTGFNAEVEPGPTPSGRAIGQPSGSLRAAPTDAG